MEGDDAGILRAGHAVPCDAIVRDLLVDFGFPALVDAADFGPPQEARVAQLAHLDDAVHELRELFELRPLVVGRADRDVDVDGLLDGGHGLLLLKRVCRTGSKFGAGSASARTWRDAYASRRFAECARSALHILRGTPP